MQPSCISAEDASVYCGMDCVVVRVVVEEGLGEVGFVCCQLGVVGLLGSVAAICSII